MGIGLDPQAIGWIDDGTEQGMLRTAVARSGLVTVPFPVGTVCTQGGAGSYMNYTADWYSGWRFMHSLLQAHTGAGATCWARAYFPFSGRVLGLVAAYTAAAQPNISVVIDGEAYPVPPWRHRWYDAGLNDIASVATEHAQFVVADDLPDGIHQAEIILAGAAAAQTVVLCGFLAEERVGYRCPPVSGRNVIYTLPTTAATTIHTIGGGGEPRLISQIVFYNSDSAPATVSLSSYGTIFRQQSIPAGGEGVFAFPVPIAYAPLALAMQASVANKVVVAVTGVY